MARDWKVGARTTVALAGLMAAGLGACRAPGPEVSDLPLPSFGAPAESLPESRPLTSGTEPPDGTDAPATSDEPVSASPSPSPSPLRESATPTGAVRRQQLALVHDEVGDFLLGDPPGHADVVAVEVRGDQTTAQVTIELAAEVPERLEEGEVAGIGFDLWTGADVDGDSDHQLFADGGSDGWRAFLQSPQGFVPYPGSFRIGGRQIVFEVPWGRLGDPTTASFRVFADWSRAGTVVNESARDDAPQDGVATFTR